MEQGEVDGVGHGAVAVRRKSFNVVRTASRSVVFATPAAGLKEVPAVHQPTLVGNRGSSGRGEADRVGRVVPDPEVSVTVARRSPSLCVPREVHAPPIA